MLTAKERIALLATDIQLSDRRKGTFVKARVSKELLPPFYSSHFLEQLTGARWLQIEPDRRGSFILRAIFPEPIEEFKQFVSDLRERIKITPVVELQAFLIDGDSNLVILPPHGALPELFGLLDTCLFHIPVGDAIEEFWQYDYYVVGDLIEPVVWYPGSKIITPPSECLRPYEYWNSAIANESFIPTNLRNPLRFGCLKTRALY